MFVRVTEVGRVATVSLHEPEDLQRLHVELNCSDEVARQALSEAGAGVLDGPEHCWVLIGYLAQEAAPVVGPEWPARLEKMVSYAGAKGWLDDAGTSVQAHLVRSR